MNKVKKLKKKESKSGLFKRTHKEVVEKMILEEEVRKRRVTWDLMAMKKKQNDY